MRFLYLVLVLGQVVGFSAGAMEDIHLVVPSAKLVANGEGLLVFSSRAEYDAYHAANTEDKGILVLFSSRAEYDDCHAGSEEDQDSGESPSGLDDPIRGVNPLNQMVRFPYETAVLYGGKPIPAVQKKSEK